MGTVLHPDIFHSPGHTVYPFQSPSRWGRCCIQRVDIDALVSAAVSVPFSMGTVLHPGRRAHARCRSACFSPLLDGDGVASAARRRASPRTCPFQSPSRWGRCCIGRLENGCGAKTPVSVPFSMGTVLHLAPLTSGSLPLNLFQSPSRWGRCCIIRSRRARGPLATRFSPLLDGDGVASRLIGVATRCRPAVSVPFSMGTVLHRWRRLLIGSPPLLFQSPSRWGRCCIVGQFLGQWRGLRFQSPSRWGRCCIAIVRRRSNGHRNVSVPFSMGTVLHHVHDAEPHGRFPAFQSPSRWGRCCIRWSACRRTRSSTVSVPFSMGTVLHRLRGIAGPLRMPQFQSPSRWGRCCIIEDFPLPAEQLDVSVPFSMGTVLHRTGDYLKSDGSKVSVPFSMGTVLHPSHFQVPPNVPLCFSPLLDGDGVASLVSTLVVQPTPTFQSPSRWGRCCIAVPIAQSRCRCNVSVPFSMGTVLHRL